MNTSTSGEQQIEATSGQRDGRQAPRANAVNKVVTIILGLLLLIAVVAAAGLGVWSYQLNTRLAAAQEQLASLQADLGKLKADHAKVTADLSQANSTIDQTKSGLSKAQADLKTANSTIASHRTQMDLAGSLMGIVAATFESDQDPSEVEAMVIRTGDAKLIGLWNTMMRTPSNENLLAFYQYLFGRIDVALK